MSDIVECPHCGKRNRVPASGSGVPRCGYCHRPLPWITAAGDDTFADVAERAVVPVLVDFWAAWCAPCRMVSPALERLARDRAGQLKLVKVDVDAAPKLADRFAIQAVPTLLLINGSEVLSRRAGAAPYEELRRWVEEAVTGGG